MVHFGETLLTMDATVLASGDLAPLLAEHIRTISIRPRNARGSWERQSISDYADVLRFLALLAGYSVELDALALFEALVAVALDVGEMDENVITLLARDETESLFCIEKLHCSLCHEYSILRTTDRPIRSVRYKRLYSPVWKPSRSAQAASSNPLNSYQPARYDAIARDRHLRRDLEQRLIRVGCDNALELDTDQAPNAISKADAESCCHTERIVGTVTMMSGPCSVVLTGQTSNQSVQQKLNLW